MKNILLDTLGHTHGYSKKNRKRESVKRTLLDDVIYLPVVSVTVAFIDHLRHIQRLILVQQSEHNVCRARVVSELYDIDSLYTRLLRSLFYSLRAARARITRICSACDDRLFALIANNAVLLRPHATGGRTCN